MTDLCTDAQINAFTAQLSAYDVLESCTMHWPIIISHSPSCFAKEELMFTFSFPASKTTLLKQCFVRIFPAFVCFSRWTTLAQLAPCGAMKVDTPLSTKRGKVRMTSKRGNPLFPWGGGTDYVCAYEGKKYGVMTSLSFGTKLSVKEKMWVMVDGFGKN